MTIAAELSAFLTRSRYEDIPPTALDHAAMLISSTLASAAMGSGLASSRIVRSLLLQRGGAAARRKLASGSMAPCGCRWPRRPASTP